jgi:hypothetical protein
VETKPFRDFSPDEKNSQAKKLFKTDRLTGDQKALVDQFLTDVFNTHEGDNPIANSLKIAAANKNTDINFVTFDKKEQYGKTHLKTAPDEPIAKQAKIEMSQDKNFATVNKKGLSAVNNDPQAKAQAYSELADTLGNELASALAPQAKNSKHHEAVTFKFGHWFSLLGKRMATQKDLDKPVTVKELEKETKTQLPDGVKKAVNTYDAYRSKEDNPNDNTALRLKQLGLFKAGKLPGNETSELVEHVNKDSDITSPDKPPEGELARWTPGDDAN